MNKEKLVKFLEEETNMVFAALMAFAAFVLGISFTLLATHGIIVGFTAFAVSGYGFKVVFGKLEEIL